MGSNSSVELPAESPWCCHGDLTCIRVVPGGVFPENMLVVKFSNVMLFLC